MDARTLGIGFLGAALGLPGCAASQQQMTGELVAVTGVAAVVAGLAIAAGCEEHEDWDEPGVTHCEGGRDANPDVGLPVSVVGLGVAIVGASIYAAAPDPTPALPSASPKSSLPPSPPSPPPPRRQPPPAPPQHLY